MSCGHVLNNFSDIIYHFNVNHSHMLTTFGQRSLNEVYSMLSKKGCKSGGETIEIR